MPAKMLATALRLEIFFISYVLLPGADFGPRPDGEGDRAPGTMTIERRCGNKVKPSAPVSVACCGRLSQAQHRQPRDEPAWTNLASRGEQGHENERGHSEQNIDKAAHEHASRP
jgi:hypothetical protein